MNRRNRARFNTDITANVTSLEYPGVCMKGRLANLSAYGLSLIIEDELPAGSPVRVQWGHSDFAGSVIYCQAYGQEFIVGLKVDQPVYDINPSRSGKSLR